MEKLAGEFPDTDQRYAVCEAQWSKRMEKKLIRRFARLTPEVDDDRIVRGVAASWDLVEADGFQLVRGALSRAVDAIKAGLVFPVLWQHRSDLMPLGRITQLEEAEEGLLFEARISETSSGNDALVGVTDETIQDVSVGFWIEALDPQNASRIIQADLQELSLATVGSGADPMATVHRTLGAYDAAYAIETMASLRNAVDRLTDLLSDENMSWGPPLLTDGVEIAIREEAAEVLEHLKAQFSKLPGGIEDA